MMGPNLKGNFSLTRAGPFPSSVEKSELSSVPTAAIICLGIGGYILLMAIALAIRRCLKTSGSTKFANCFASECHCPKCHPDSCFEGKCSSFSSCNCCNAFDCSCCQCNCKAMKERCMELFTCDKNSCCQFKSILPLCLRGDPLCQCGNCNCVCACQLPQCQSINCCCFEIRIRP